MSNKLCAAERAQLELLMATASSRPWTEDLDWTHELLDADGVCLAKFHRHTADPALIVAAVNTLPRLLARLDELEAKLEGPEG